MSLSHRATTKRSPRLFTTIYCGDVVWLFQSSWDDYHHKRFVQSRYNHTTNTDLPNRVAAFTGRWVLLINQEYQGWAEFHYHNQRISINHLILSDETNWAKTGQQALTFLLASLFQDANTDIIEIPVYRGQNIPIHGETRTVWAPRPTRYGGGGDFISILQVQRSWLAEEESKDAANRVRPLVASRRQLKIEEQITKKGWQKSHPLFRSW